MCGIFGILNLESEMKDVTTFEKMSRSLTHRGPDDKGYVFFELKGNQRFFSSKEVTNDIPVRFFEGLLVLGHRRLSIIDLSPAGHQPMSNETEDIWIVYNGEIYNYQELTEELRRKGHIFRSKSDTEVILHAYEEWGVECLRHFNGMWAFALWDRNRKKLFCAKDRFAIKPFYYYIQGQRFIFASEIKAILQDPDVQRYPNDKRVYDYLAYGYLDHTNETFFKDVYQLRGAHYLVLDIQRGNFELEIHPYWDLTPKKEEITDHFDDRFLELFQDSVRLHLRSDVPVGTCLSGGLDSSSIVSVSKRFFNSTVHKTFSSCFDDKKYDERDFIMTVVESTQSEAHYVFPKAEDLLAEIEDLIWYQDEPFGSTSIFAQWSVFKSAKLNEVKVILDGQGADELLGGYHPYFGVYLAELMKRFQWRQFLQEYLKIKRVHGYSNDWLIRHLIFFLIPRQWLGRVRKQILLQQGKWINFDDYHQEERAAPRKFKNIFLEELYQSLMAVRLPALLHYEDRNSMAHSIEARVPFLDYRLVEFVFSLPMDQFIQGGMTKVVLRKAMDGILPEKIRARKDKIGFATPEEIWFRTSLRVHINDILCSRSFEERIYFNVKEVKKAFKGHCEGRMNMSSTIWRLVNLELWLRTFIDENSSNRVGKLTA